MSIDFAAMFAEELAAQTEENEDSPPTEEATPLPLPPTPLCIETLTSSHPVLGVNLPEDWRISSKICTPLNSVWVCNQALSTEDATSLLNSILHEEVADAGLWVNLKGRRVLEWGKDGSAIPPYLHGIIAVLEARGVWGGLGCNHVLINEYDCEGGIMPHTDGPAYYPETATLSLVEPALFRFAPRLGVEVGGAECLTLLLRALDLVVFAEDLYTKYTHEILEGRRASVPPECLNNAEQLTEVCRKEKRISLTFRHKLR